MLPSIIVVRIYWVNHCRFDWLGLWFGFSFSEGKQFDGEQTLVLSSFLINCKVETLKTAGVPGLKYILNILSGLD